MVTWIYHFTHADNFARIIQSGALICDRECAKNSLTARSIAYSNIKLARAGTLVEAGPGGNLDEYVPFYFGPRSPMLLAYTTGKVTGRRENPNHIVYFATQAEHIAATGHRFAFTDGHPIRQPKAFYDSLDKLNEVDHNLMRAERWKDTDDDNDRQRRRQAEFLVHRKVPLNAVKFIGVRTENMAAWVTEVTQNLEPSVPCVIRPTWYY
ncbi:DUF4433 domain-containing protein [Parafrankia sp. FMc6]|uniref:type II toxin-antitoxin system toxin DNA ADP-ribosyl transferase DarT n=1 Tax=Parafrankia soli TaxID=2599596 RepID=UPI0034D4EC26